MRKTLAPLFLAVALLSGHGEAQMQILKGTIPSNVSAASIRCGDTDSNSYGSFTTTTASAVYRIGGATKVEVTIYGSGGTFTGVIPIQVGPTTSGPWTDVCGTPTACPTNVATTGVVWTIPAGEFLKLAPSSLSAGTMNACISAWRDANRIY